MIGKFLDSLDLIKKFLLFDYNNNYHQIIIRRSNKEKIALQNW